MLAKLQANGHLVVKEINYQLLWADVTPFMRGLLEPMVPTLLTTTLLLVGEADYAKTPLNMILAFMMARF